jgi:hypothetical protein
VIDLVTDRLRTGELYLTIAGLLLAIANALTLTCNSSTWLELDDPLSHA